MDPKLLERRLSLLESRTSHSLDKIQDLQDNMVELLIERDEPVVLDLLREEWRTEGELAPWGSGDIMLIRVHWRKSARNEDEAFERDRAIAEHLLDTFNDDDTLQSIEVINLKGVRQAQLIP